MHYLATMEHTMFVPTRRKAAGENRPANILRSSTDTVQSLNHWAWTGWMPEAERDLSQPGVQSTARRIPPLAA